MSKRRIDKRKVVAYRKDIYNLGRSFLFAFRGFQFTVDNERNMRIHLSVIVFVLEFSFLYGLTKTEYIQLITLFGLVLTAEMINTAIEALVNLQTQSYQNLARIAKDVAAGAVLVLAVASVVVGIIIFFDIPKLQQSFLYMVEHPWIIAGFLVELVLALLFIFRWNRRTLLKRKKK